MIKIEQTRFSLCLLLGISKNAEHNKSLKGREKAPDGDLETQMVVINTVVSLLGFLFISYISTRKHKWTQTKKSLKKSLLL